MKEAPPGGRRGFFRISHAWRGGREDRHCGPLSTLRSSVNPYRGVAGYPKMKEAPPGERGFFLNVHVERDVMARGETTTHTGLSLSHSRGAVILSHDRTRRTLRISACARVAPRDITGTLPFHCRRGATVGRAKRSVPTTRWAIGKSRCPPYDVLRVHRVEELGIALGLLQLVEQELDGVLGAHRVQDAAEHVHLLELIAGNQELLFARA